MPALPSISFPRIEVRFCVALALMFAYCGHVSSAQDADDTVPDVRPGLVARYTDANGNECMRVDDAVRFVWHEPPDARLTPGQFRATWEGLLRTQAPGRYELSVYAQGEVSLSIDGETVLDGSTAEPTWLESTPMTLSFGDHPLRLSYKSAGAIPQLKLYWQGPRFELEPLSPRWLFHVAADAPDDTFEFGARLARALRCAACHQLGSADVLPAPDLDRAGGNLSPDWVAAHLQARAPAEEKLSERRMPYFGLSRSDAEALAAYLFAHSAADGKAPAEERRDDGTTSADISAGEKLFRTIGCLACHRLGELGNAGLFGGGNLNVIADKRPDDFFARWLADPASINSHHRMPSYSEPVTNPKERNQLAAYLATLKAHVAQPHKSHEKAHAFGTPAQIERGRRLASQWRCAACHQMPGIQKNVAERITLDGPIDWSASCLSDSNHESHQPGYALGRRQREALTRYVESMSGAPRDAKLHAGGERLLEENNCLACHARDGNAGIASSLEAVTAADPELRSLLPALAPPSLNEIGDKLPDDELHRAIRSREPRLRPWLAVRMPRFAHLDETQVDQLAQHFVDTDRIPDRQAKEALAVDGRPRAATSAEVNDPAALRLAGSRLVTSAGFGCTSCHKIGSVAPVTIELGAHGSDLTMIGTRIRRDWFDRWVHNPARMVPQMEMPAVQVPVRGVLNDHLASQLAAVWEVLNRPGFEPPRPGPIRVVRSNNRAELAEQANVLTDVLETSFQRFIKPFLVGLPNRHNVLFDLDTHHLAGWWVGDTARQHTRGKTWYWEAGGSPILAPATGTPDIELIGADGTLYVPERTGQFVTEFDWYEKTPDGVRFACRLSFRSALSEGENVRATVVQTFEATPSGEENGRAKSGWRRRMVFEDLPTGFLVRIRPFAHVSLEQAPRLSADGRALEIDAGGGINRVRLTAPDDARFRNDGDGEFWTSIPVSTSTNPTAIELTYATGLPVDQFFEPEVEPLIPPRTALPVVPGFETTGLALPGEIMPTGFAWRADGAMFVCSLKGRVWAAHDSDGDGLVDELQPFSDELATPYGLAVNDDAVDVINKFGLIRLRDRDRDGRAERTELVASGWGHTADYHDWAVGLVSDGGGNYYVALPCQQDDRSLAAAELRGRALRLMPRDPTPDDPRRYALETISAGLRFPMGLAQNRAGDLFVTDNQGNYNPFNELNHLVKGARYGFINKLENRPGFDPARTDPAINIPHPWTRSVNGICFLYTPEDVRAALAHDLFGPFEGHLVGCEYDTRRLIRMSLQRVGDTYQGAVYPLSIEPAAGEPTFMGPVVCQVSPKGGIYIGDMRDSGWGAGANIGGIVRLRATGDLPVGIAEMRAFSGGFNVTFTAPVDERAAADAANYSLISYRRVPTPAYGGLDVDRRDETIRRVEVAGDARCVRFLVNTLREGFVYELRIGDIGHEGATLFPAEAHYTLNRIPGE